MNDRFLSVSAGRIGPGRWRLAVQFGRLTSERGCEVAFDEGMEPEQIAFTLRRLADLIERAEPEEPPARPNRGTADLDCRRSRIPTAGEQFRFGGRTHVVRRVDPVVPARPDPSGSGWLTTHAIEFEVLP